MIAPDTFVSLFDMLELHAGSFLSAATEIARLRQIMVGIHESDARNAALESGSIANIKPRLAALYQEA